MKTSLDCIPCLLRQSLQAARRVSTEPAIHEQMMREILYWTGKMDFNQSPPAVAQHMHRRLRQVTGLEDPYLDVKAEQDRIAMEYLPALRRDIRSSDSPLMAAARIAIAGNMIDLGVHDKVSQVDVHQAVRQAASAPFYGEMELFSQAVGEARSILYLADNAGEIAFDRLLIEQMDPGRVTLVVRGSPVINDATRVDAHAVGLDDMVAVMDNGSDAPGTILEDCSQEFRRRFAEADLIIAKGQGNFESLGDEKGNIFFLFQVKCEMIADHILQPVGTQVLACPGWNAKERTGQLDRLADDSLLE